MIYSGTLLLAFVALVRGCTNLLVTPGASSDGSSMITYNADSGTLFGSLYHYPAADHPPGTMRDIYDWDSGRYLGQIAEVEHTYNVVGNMNEFSLAIGETTYGGLSDLQEQDAAKIDYGSIIWVTLQRAKTSREAIAVLGELMATYGWASEGESFSISDPNEVWIMEIIGKGNYELGAVWVAQRVPDGYVSGHANQARITTFPLNDPENCIYSPDVISFARARGYYSGADEDFSFSDVYDPVTFSGARACDARVWSYFSALMGQEWSNQYLDYAQGYNLTNRMPLWVKPAAKVELSSVMEAMRNHYESSWLAMTEDVGAAFGEVPYRWRPMSWTSGGSSYVHERAIATQQTGWNFVAQSRSNVPLPLSGLLWFGVDDSATTVRFPMFSSATSVPASFAGQGPQDGVTPPMMKFNMQHAFYVFNLVSNWAYSRWNVMYPDVYSAITAKEEKYIKEVAEIDKQALAIYQSAGAGAAVEFLTRYSVAAGDELVKNWSNFFGEMFVKYRDGYVVTADAADPACGCSVGTVSYPQKWYDRIAESTGTHYEEPDTFKAQAHKTVPKSELKAMK